MAGTIYIRQSSFADGDTITAALFNNEFNQLANAFSYTTSGTTGHTHDGTDGQGGHISKIGDQDFKNKIVADSTNNRWGIFVEVAGTSTEQLRVVDGAIVPVLDSDINLGSPTAYFKDSYIDTVTTTGAVAVGGALSAASFAIGGTALTATITELNTLDGITATTAELNYTDGVTSNIQTQLNAKQPLDAQLTDIASLTPTDGTFIVGNGTNFVAENPATALASLGVTSTATELNILDGTTVTTTELNYVHNVTSPIQTQLNAKQALNAKLTDISNLTLADNFFLVSTGTNLALESPATALGSLGVTATATELNYVDGVTSSIQTQLNTKAPLASPTFTGTLTAPIINATSDLKIGGETIGATVTEINYLSGVTSSVQTQLDALQASDTDLSAIAALTPSDSTFIVGNGTSWAAETGATVRASLGLTIGTDVQAYDVDTAKYDAATANFTGTLQNGGSNVVVDSDIGSTVLAYDSNLQSFVTTFTIPTTDGTSGQALLTDGAGNISFGDVDALPTQTGNSGYFLTTDGTNPSWAEVDALPDQTGNSGKYLTTDGSIASWAVVDIPSFVYTRSNFTATASQTTFTVSYTVGYVDVYLNGVKLIVGTDVTATSGTSIVLATGATAGDLVEVVAFETFEVADVYTQAQSDARYAQFASPTFTGTVTADGLSLGDNDKATFGNSNDLEIYHDGSNSYISDVGTGSLRILAQDFRVRTADNAGQIITGVDGGQVNLYYNSDLKLATTATGIDVTGTATMDGLTVGGTVAATNLQETVYALTGTALDAGNGGIQTKTLSANTTFTDSLSSGDAIVLQLEAGASYTVTWPTMTWVTSGGNVAPTLTAKDTLVFWKVSTTLYGAYTGSYV